jgi:hypothetical protein
VFLPIANPDNNQHAADENLRVGNLWCGVDLFAPRLMRPQRRPAELGEPSRPTATNLG